MTEHKYAQALRWIADGEKVQWQDSNGKWVEQDISDTLFEIAGSEYSPERYRLPLTTITINGVEIEAPFAPELGEKCWIFGMHGEVKELIFDRYDLEVVLVKNGNCYRSKEAAAAAFSAVTKALTQKAG